MLAGALAVAILIARLFPETPTGKWLHVHFVEIPLRAASGVERKYVIFALLVLIAGPTIAAAAPVDLALIYALDVSLYIDAVIVVGTAAAFSRCRSAWAAFKMRTSTILRTVRNARPPSARRRATKAQAQRLPSNDDDAAPGTWAAAA